jgi:uncharacterized Fe-S cluster protein YjdI
MSQYNAQGCIHRHFCMKGNDDVFNAQKEERLLTRLIMGMRTQNERKTPRCPSSFSQGRHINFICIRCCNLDLYMLIQGHLCNSTSLVTKLVQE